MMQPWFKEAKLGIFIHYGIYSVKGTAESWYFRFSPLTRYRPYMKQIEGFTAKNYDPEYWAKLFKEAGAKYAVLTTKHHDGVALFDTKFSDLSVVKQSPAKRDLVAPYCDALRNNDLRVGLYFTQCDWSAKDYTAKNWHPVKYFIDTYLLNKKHWKMFKQFHRSQLTEILTNYGKIDLLWFDGDWERSQADWDMKGLKQWLTEKSPETVINSRIGSYGDYATPEQQMPTMRPDGPWEYCMTINNSWGYQPKDKNFKTPEQIVRIFSEIVSMGGNLLLDIGPKEDGTILPEQENVLRRLGEFARANEKAIWGTDTFEADVFSGGKTISRDGKTLYCFSYGATDKSIPVFVPSEKVTGVTLVNGEQSLDFSKDGDKIWVKLSPKNYIHDTAVFAVDFNEDIREGK